MYILGANMDN